MNTKLLRQKILDLAIRGKLTEQKKSDGTTAELLAQMSFPAPTGNLAASSNKKKGKSAEPKQIIPLDKSEAPFEIPENWEWVRLGDYLDVRDGTHDSPKYVEVGYPFVTSKNLVNGTIDFSTCKQVSKDDYDKFNERSCVEDGDILYAMIGSIGNAVLVKKDRDFAIKNVALFKKRFSQTDMNYVYYWLYFVEKSLKENAAGGLQPFISLSMFRDNSFPLPPLAEQHRIVTAIENAFAEITEIENNQELLKKHIKQGRQKILDLAIRGKLTQQLKTDGTTKDLLAQMSFPAPTGNLVTSSSKKKGKSIEPKQIVPLDKTTAPFEIPSTWEWVKLGDLSEKIQYGYNAPAKESGRIKMVRITDIHENTVDWETVPYCDIDESEIPTYLLKKNDILFARTGGTVGKSFIVKNVPVESVYAGYLIRTRYDANIDAQYMKYFMESSLYWEQLREGCIATAQPNCNGQTLGKMQIPLPPLAEQQRIVTTIEQAFAEFDAMENGTI